METIEEEDDKEVKMYERESMQMKQNLQLDNIKNEESQRSSANSKNENENYKESKTYQEPMRFTKMNESLLNAIEEYQEQENENQKEINSIIQINNNNNKEENIIQENYNINNDENENILMKQTTILNNLKEYKIIVLGDYAVGKTSLIYRYLNNKFKQNIKEKGNNLENNIKIMQVDENTKIKLNIWNISGQENNGIIFKQYYIDIYGALIVFDLTNKQSFENTNKWIKNLDENSPKDIVICYVGNKSDLTEDRNIKYEDVKDAIKDKLYYEVSSKTGNNVSLAFEQLIYSIIDKQKEEENNPEKVIRGTIGRHTTGISKEKENDLKRKKKCCL